MTHFWHNDSSTLYEGTPEQPGRMLGWCQRVGDRHKEAGWMAFFKGELIWAGTIIDRVDHCYFLDECMARQAVLDAVAKESK